MIAILSFPAFALPTRHARSGFESIPSDLSRTELLRYFTFSDIDLREITQCRGTSNRIGFAVTSHFLSQ